MTQSSNFSCNRTLETDVVLRGEFRWPATAPIIRKKKGRNGMDTFGSVIFDCDGVLTDGEGNNSSVAVPGIRNVRNYLLFVIYFFCRDSGFQQPLRV